MTDRTDRTAGSDRADPGPRFRRATELDPATADRLRARLAPYVAPYVEQWDGLRDDVMRVTRADADTLDRVHARIDASRQRRLGWSTGGFALAMAALALWLGSRAPVAERIEAAPSPDDVSLSLAGVGRIGGTDRAPVIAWESGSLTVEVRPDRTADLTITTPEATVRVAQAAVVVDRTHHETRVDVRDGAVE
ncbi:MAG: FecR domain-containing protein, partial [Myxococcota bacterium]